MKWQTIVEAGELTPKINYKDKITLVGSCFASEIGGIMGNLRFNSVTNPLGVMFNPASVANTLTRIEDCTFFTNEDVFENGGVYKSFYHGSEFASNTIEGFLDSNNKLLERASSHFRESKFVVITLGTSWAYVNKFFGKVVSNCHKLPASDFDRVFLTHEESFALLAPIIERNNDKEWIITVSPVRHLKDGALGNQVSKANLIILANRLRSHFKNVTYFPAYEIFMDELRDYRFYASDMVHPSIDAVRYVWERFRRFSISGDCDHKIKMVESLNAMKNHKVLFPDTAEYYMFLKKIEELENKISKLEV